MFCIYTDSARVEGVVLALVESHTALLARGVHECSIDVLARNGNSTESCDHIARRQSFSGSIGQAR